MNLMCTDGRSPVCGFGRVEQVCALALIEWAIIHVPPSLFALNTHKRMSGEVLGVMCN